MNNECYDRKMKDKDKKIKSKTSCKKWRCDFKNKKVIVEKAV